MLQKIHECKYTKGNREDIDLAGEIYAYKFEHNPIPSYFLFVEILGEVNNMTLEVCILRKVLMFSIYSSNKKAFKK